MAHVWNDIRKVYKLEHCSQTVFSTQANQCNFLKNSSQTGVVVTINC